MAEEGRCEVTLNELTDAIAALHPGVDVAVTATCHRPNGPHAEHFRKSAAFSCYIHPFRGFHSHTMDGLLAQARDMAAKGEERIDVGQGGAK